MSRIKNITNKNGSISYKACYLNKDTYKLESKNFDNLDTTSQQIINILEEYVKPQVIADEISNMLKEFDEKLMSEKCQGLEWQVLTEVVSKIINNKTPLLKLPVK